MAKELEETKFTFSDGATVYMRKWLPTTAPLAKLVFVHAYNDHINRYLELFPTLASRGIKVIGWDQRGFGLSVTKPAERGLSGPSSTVLNDVAEVIKSELPSNSNQEPVPVFLMGHSMGGGIVIALASLPEYQALVKDIRGLLLESPYIALPAPMQPSRLTAVLGRVASKFLPHYQIVGKPPVTYYSRDPAVQKNKEEDELCYATGTLEILSSMMDRAANIDSGAWKLSKDVTSLVLFHGTGDQVTSFDASKRWIERQQDIEDITFRPLEGWSHGLHCDLPDNRSVFAKEVGDWILARSDVKE